MSDPAGATRQFPRRASLSDRISAGVLAAGCLTVLVLAAWIQADPAGHGSHTQIGLSECAWAEYFDAPCATCGMTTSFAYAADFDWIDAFLTQPFGAALAIVTSVVFWGSLHVSATGSRLGVAVAPALSAKALVIAAGFFLAAWAFKWAMWE